MIDQNEKIKLTMIIDYSDYIIFDDYRHKISAINSYQQSQYHGVEHVLRVLLLMMLLTKQRDVTRQERALLMFSAVYHDIGRINDIPDLLHGIRGWKMIKSTMDLSMFGGDELYIRYIIENHCIEMNQAIKNIRLYEEIDACKAEKLLRLLMTCDKLDMFRYQWFTSEELNLKIDMFYQDIAKKMVATSGFVFQIY
jgi:hypothetical protein